VAGPESGVTVYGEQRGAALADYDGDGRVDLAVTQNGAETKLFRNEGAIPGLRVRLRGPLGNPSGIGAVLRLVFGQRMGPAREIHAGSGYWSQDSVVQVLATPDPPPKSRSAGPEATLVTPKSRKTRRKSPFISTANSNSFANPSGPTTPGNVETPFEAVLYPDCCTKCKSHVVGNWLEYPTLSLLYPEKLCRS
jgi:hypothetical protein